MSKLTQHAPNGKAKTNGKAKPEEAQDLLGPPITGKYRSWSMQFFKRPRDLPPFTFLTVQAMLLDPTILLGLAAREAPLLQSEFAYKDGEQWIPGVRASSEVVAAFVMRQLKTVWRQIHAITSNQIWGWAAAEITYRLTPEQTVEINELLPRAATDTKVLIQDSRPVGVQFERVDQAKSGKIDVYFPRALFVPFEPEPGQWYGESVLLGAYSPWADKWLSGGALDVRRLFMHKDAYGGTDIAYPEGLEYQVPGKGAVSSRDIAAEIGEQCLAGNVTFRPSGADPTTGKERWTITRATIPGNPAHILEYPRDLDVEMLRGLLVPDDILTSENTGAWAGKQVPLSAFYNVLEKWLRRIIASLKPILETVVKLNYGEGHWFELETKPLATQAAEQQNAQQAAQRPNPMDNIGTGGDFEMQQGGQQQRPPQMQRPPQRMSLEEAVGAGIISAEEVVSRVRATRMEVAHAPKGGATVGGKKYTGGEFIPGDVLDKATPEEKAALKQKTQEKGQAKPKLSDAEKKAKADATFTELMKTKSPEDVKAFSAARADGIAIPPAWTEVVYYGKDKHIRAEGRDSAGRKQRAEDPDYRQKISDANNARISAELAPRMPELRATLREAAKAGDENAKVLYLISLTGFRIGGKGDGKSKVEAFGASSLKGEHVTVSGDTVTFDFPGKKGVQQKHVVTDKIVADMMRQAKPGEKVFKTNDVKVRDAWQNEYGGTKVHDIRHVIATETARAELAKLVPPKPKTAKERNAIIKAVSTAAAETLGNNPAQALGTYIDPAIWQEIA